MFELRRRSHSDGLGLILNLLGVVLVLLLQDVGQPVDEEQQEKSDDAAPDRVSCSGFFSVKH